MTRDAEHTPSSQSAVVRRADLEEVRDLLMERIHGSNARSPAHNARLAVEAMLAAAPAPSSLAGGEVTNDDAPTYMRLAQALSRHPEVMVVERSDPTLELTPDSLEHLLDDVFPLAALSPEAPARDGEKLPDGAISGTDDGQTVWLESHTGGAHKLGVWGGLSLRFEEADGSHSIRDYVDTSLTPRHEAPAEGAGEAMDAGFEAWLNERNLLPNGAWDWPSIVAMLNHHEDALRARSSAPEARSGEGQ